MYELATVTAQSLVNTCGSDLSLPSNCLRTAGIELPRFGNDLKSAIQRDLDNNSHSTLRKIVEPTALASSIIGELTVGNEAVVLGFGSLAMKIAGVIYNTDNLAADTIATGITTGALVGMFSYYQQRAFGSITRWGLKRYPATIETASLIANTKREHMNENYESDGNAAVVIGTSLAFIRHKTRHPDSNGETENRVIKRGARPIAAFWAGAIGLHSAISTASGADSKSPILDWVHNVTQLQNLAMIAGVAYVGYEWVKLLSERMKLRSDNSE